MRHPLPKVPDGPYYEVLLKDLYRKPRYKKPRKARRLRRRRAKWWASLSSEERALAEFLIGEITSELAAEIDQQILYGDGSDVVLTGIFSD